MLTIAADLQALGHDVVICACDGVIGPIGSAATAAGLSVVAGVHSLPDSVDATIANDASSAFEFVARFPQAARIMVAHSDFFPLQWPPQLPGVCDAVVAMNSRIARHISSLANAPRVERLCQPIDLHRFIPTAPAPTSLRSVLVFGNYMGGPMAAELAAAGKQAGVEVAFAGMGSVVAERPERLMVEHDAVLGLGRCILEAMACGRAAYVFGIAGGDGWVTADNYAALESDGFGGLAESRVMTGSQVAATLSHWHPTMGSINRRLVTAHHDSMRHAVALVELLSSLVKPADAVVRTAEVVGSSDEVAAELLRLTRLEWWTRSRWSAVTEELVAVRRQRDAARSKLKSVLRSRSFRLARMLAKPIDTLRATVKRLRA